MTQILVVDDSETLRSEIRKILEHAGFAVTEAGNGKEGLLRLASQKEIKLILCDINMPVMDGISMCRAIHQDRGMSKIPIIIMSTEASPDLKKAGKEAGVVAWMTKPVDKDKLVMAVKKITGAA